MVKVAKICEITLGYICKSIVIHKTYIKCENFTKSITSPKLLLKCR
jgi:hypothetical protein